MSVLEGVSPLAGIGAREGVSPLGGGVPLGGIDALGGISALDGGGPLGGPLSDVAEVTAIEGASWLSLVERVEGSVARVWKSDPDAHDDVSLG